LLAAGEPPGLPTGELVGLPTGEPVGETDGDAVGLETGVEGAFGLVGSEVQAPSKLIPANTQDANIIVFFIVLFLKLCHDGPARPSPICLKAAQPDAAKCLSVNEISASAKILFTTC
jgi:hypothetical protein